jgi:NADPH-dependent 2,4-dienoyl-CoA reductase/sulfur reductase-like enzyme/nitrite reductase/ring-hydroxylating ferredoxin subunit
MTLIALGAADSLLRDGPMQRFDVDGKAVLLTRISGEYHAVRATCSHYGGNLAEGALSGTTVICPLHHACFDVRSGVRLEPPALNDIPRFAVSVQDGQVMVETEPVAPAAIPGASADDPRTFVIIGGGAAGNAAAEELRRQGFGGRIVILSASGQLPIDRPNVSKDYLDGHAKPEWMPLRGANWYAERGIDLRLNVEVASLDTAAKTLLMEDGDRMTYDKLLIATGGTPRTLRVPGASLRNIFTLREQADADAIIAAKGESGAKAVVIGASFIGLEAANALASTGAQVTVVGLEAVPFENVLGARIGSLFQTLHERNGVQFKLSSGVEQYIGGDDGAVTGVQIKGGEVLPCDFVVLGVGVSPATIFLGESALKLNDRDRAVLTDAHLQAAPDVWAAGDIARYPADGATQRIEHWRVAQQHGILAARAMLDKPEPVASRVPFFWTKQWGTSLRYVGHAAKWDEIIVHGSIAPDGKFIAYYIANGKLAAAAGVGFDTQIAALNLLMRENRTPSVEHLRDPAYNDQDA